MNLLLVAAAEVTKELESLTVLLDMALKLRVLVATRGSLWVASVLNLEFFEKGKHNIVSYLYEHESRVFAIWTALFGPSCTQL